MTEPQMGGTYEEIPYAARLAEAEGLVSFARSDHLAWDRENSPDATDAFATLAGLARETSTIRLCILVSPITFRHPAIIAKNAATIDQMSGGRLDLGVGTGWNDFEHEALGIPFPDEPERWNRLEDAVGYLEAALGEGRGHYRGRYYSLDLDVKPKPQGVRMVIGGSGLMRTPSLAGRVADEYNMFVCPPDEARAKIATMRRAASGREVEATMMGPVTIAGSDGELAERLLLAAGRWGITRDELLSRWERAGVIFGTRSQVLEKIEAFDEAGVERMYLQWLDLADHEGMARMLDLVRA